MIKLIKLILLIGLLAAAGLAGYYFAKQGGDPAIDQLILDTETFYATIESIAGKSLTVQGIDENDRNFRSKFTFKLEDSTILEWHKTKITPSDLKVGDRISVTTRGIILESNPAQLPDVPRVQLLEDEK